MQKIQLGISPLTWMNDDMPTLGGNTSLHSCLSEMRSAGFSGSEMGQKYPKEALALQTLLKNHNLSLASGWYSLKLCDRSIDEEIEAITPHIELLKACNCKVIVAGEVSNTVHGNINIPLSKRVRLTNKEWLEYGKKLSHLANFTEKHGLKLAFHHHVGTICESPEDLLTLIDVTTPSVGITFDTAHIIYGGGDPLDLIERVASRIVHFHAKDVRQAILDDAKHRDLPFLEAVLNGVFTVPGDGDLPFQDICHALKKQGYSGWVVVEAEQDPEKAHPKTYADMAFNNMQHYLKSSSFTLV